MLGSITETESYHAACWSSYLRAKKAQCLAEQLRGDGAGAYVAACVICRRPVPKAPLRMCPRDRSHAGEEQRARKRARVEP